MVIARQHQAPEWRLSLCLSSPLGRWGPRDGEHTRRSVQGWMPPRWGMETYLRRTLPPPLLAQQSRPCPLALQEAGREKAIFCRRPEHRLEHKCHTSSRLPLAGGVHVSKGGEFGSGWQGPAPLPVVTSPWLCSHPWLQIRNHPPLPLLQHLAQRCIQPSPPMQTHATDCTWETAACHRGPSWTAPSSRWMLGTLSAFKPRPYGSIKLTGWHAMK